MTLRLTGFAIEPVESRAVIARLNMLQAAVAGLAGDRAQRKTWCVAIVSALFGLARAANSGRIAAAAIIPTGVFGFVDAYLANGKPSRFATTQSSRKSWTSATVSLASPI